jgi:undecaprenyl-diphosphatase
MMRALAPGARLRHAIIPLSAAALAFGLFLLIAVAVSTGLTRGIDAWGLLALRDAADASRPFGPAWLQETGRDFTGLGSNGVLAVLVLAGSGLLALARRRTEGLFLLASFWGALALETLLKHWYGRPRPELVPHAVPVFTASFPSGHATVSAAVGFAVAALLAQSRSGRRFGTLTAAVAACLIALIGASRVYLGVHWPTDVAAGWVLGAGWAALCRVMLARDLIRREQHEYQSHP